MNIQETFDTVATHLLTQLDTSLDADGACAYLGRNGAKCAVGCLIGLDEYSADIEGLSVVNLHIDYPIFFKNINDENVEILSKLQSIHDGAEPAEWKVSLGELAKANALNTEVLDKF